MSRKKKFKKVMDEVMTRRASVLKALAYSEVEDRLDYEDAVKALAEAKIKGTVSFDELTKKLNIKTKAKKK